MPGLRLLALICMFMATSACSLVDQGVFPRKSISINSNTQEPFQAAMQAFQSNEYAIARKKFSSLVKSATEPRIKQKAQFGVACSAIAGAKNKCELKKALHIFENWAVNAPRYLQNEDPRLLYPVLKEYYEKYSHTIFIKKNNCDCLKITIQKLNKKNRNLIKKHDCILKENKSLKEKIQALEEMQNELRKMRQVTTTENNETRIN